MRSPLAGLVVLEALSPGACPALALAIAMAGRICADLGAPVFRHEPADRSGQEGEDHEAVALKAFLDAEKFSAIRNLDDGSWPADGLYGAVVTDSIDWARAQGFGAPIFVEVSTHWIRNEVSASEVELMAMSGIMDIIGSPDRNPLALGGHQAAYASGLAVYTAIVSAANLDASPSEPAIFTVNLLDVLSWVNWKAVAGNEISGAPIRRQGAKSEWQVVPCKDGHVAVIYEPQDWPELAKMTGSDLILQLVKEPRATKLSRLGDYMAVFRDWCKARTRVEIYEEAKHRRLPFGPVWTLDELPADKVFVERSFFRPLSTAFGEAVRPGLPVRWNGIRQCDRSGAI